MIVDPRERSVTWLALADGEYRPLEDSARSSWGRGSSPGSSTGRSGAATEGARQPAAAAGTIIFTSRVLKMSSWARSPTHSVKSRVTG